MTYRIESDFPLESDLLPKEAFTLPAREAPAFRPGRDSADRITVGCIVI